MAQYGNRIHRIELKRKFRCECVPEPIVYVEEAPFSGPGADEGPTVVCLRCSFPVSRETIQRVLRERNAKGKTT